MKFSKIDLNNYQKPSRFLRFKEGENRIRVLTDGYTYHVAGKKTARGFVRAIIGDGKMPEFLQDVEPKLTYGFVVYSFDTGHFHVLETGPTLGDQLVQLLQQMPDEQYKTTDILINRKGMGMSDTVYNAEFAKESTDMPKEANRNHPEFLLMLRYFDE